MAILTSNTIFFHLPRTGGTWLSKFLSKNLACLHLNRKHSAPVHVGRVLKQVGLDDRFRFSFVRNPIYWYRSKYAAPTHIARVTKKNTLIAIGNPIFQIDAKSIEEPFQDWIGRLLIDKPGWLTWYHNWFYGPRYSSLDFVGRYETQIPQLRRVFNLSGQQYDSNIFHRANIERSEIAPEESGNFRDKRKTNCYYTREQIQQIIEQEAPIFRRFKYSTDVDSYQDVLS